MESPAPTRYAWSVDAFSPTTDMYATDSPGFTSSASPHSAASISSDEHCKETEMEPVMVVDPAIALRRQRNRESMRRMRLKAKETITELRSTVARLEAQYARLTDPWTEDASANVKHRAFLQELRRKLEQLVALRRSLEIENVALNRVVGEKEQLEKELQQILDDNALDEMMNEKLSLLEEAVRSPSLIRPSDGFKPLTPPQVQHLVSSFLLELQRVRSDAASAVAEDEALEIFGWRVQRHIDASTNELHFEFAKAFDHITAQEMADRAWTQGMDVQKFRETERQLNIRRLGFLQHVSSDVKVMVREILHPVDGTVFRTNYLTFKVPTPRGFLVGMRSVNPTPEEQQELPTNGERVVWIDISVSVELVAVGASSCQACWRGSTNYKSPQYAAENAVKFLMGMLRWEYAIIGPQLQFEF